MLRFARDDVSFQYPAAWQARQWDWVSSFSALITYLSPNALHNPCSQTKVAQWIRVACGAPINQLPAGGVLVTWTSDGFPSGPGSLRLNAKVGGFPVAETLSVPGSCADIGGDETVRVVILRATGADNWYTMTACLRSPGLRQDEQAIQAMLKTFHARLGRSQARCSCREQAEACGAGRSRGAPSRPVVAALAVSRWIEDRNGWSIRKFLRSAPS